MKRMAWTACVLVVSSLGISGMLAGGCGGDDEAPATPAPEARLVRLGRALPVRRQAVQERAGALAAVAVRQRHGRHQRLG